QRQNVSCTRGPYCIVVVDGFDRRAMESRFNHPSRRPNSRRQTRTPLERSTDCSQRCALDSSDRRAVERSALAIRPIPDGAPAVPKLGSFWGDRKNFARAGRASPRGRRTRPQRVLRGWDFRTRQKRGLCIGKTKRGKGTKIMGIADGHGLPIALRTESASPAEVKL